MLAPHLVRPQSVPRTHSQTAPFSHFVEQCLLRFSLTRYTDCTCAQGRINIPFNTIPYNKNISRWFPLHPTHGRKSNVHGEISLNLHFKVRACCNTRTHNTTHTRLAQLIKFVML